jgi:large subunit ribosomal protein L35
MVPKNKTHSGSQKRFRISGTGKLLHRRANRNHLLEHKPTTRTRRLDAEVVMSKSDVRKVRKLLGR